MLSKSAGSLGLAARRQVSQAWHTLMQARLRGRTFQRLNDKLFRRSCPVLGSSCHTIFASRLPFQHYASVTLPVKHAQPKQGDLDWSPTYCVGHTDADKASLSTRPRRRSQAISTVKPTADIHDATHYSADLCTAFEKEIVYTWILQKSIDCIADSSLSSIAQLARACGC